MMLLVISAPSSPGVRSLRRPRAIHMGNAAARLREYRLDDVSSEVKAAIDGGLICEHWVGIENRLSGGFFLPRSGSAMSGSVQVFGRRDDETLPALRRPAAEKRQGTKSRWVTGRGCRGRYGDFAAGLGLLRLERCGRRARFSSKGPGLRGWKRVERP
jgi:hypothetical protein